MSRLYNEKTSRRTRGRSRGDETLVFEELKCYEEAFERREVLALARALRSYDGLRDIAAGPCAFGFGTHTRTIRGRIGWILDTVRLGRLLPAGMGEAASLGTARGERTEARDGPPPRSAATYFTREGAHEKGGGSRGATSDHGGEKKSEEKVRGRS